MDAPIEPNRKPVIRRLDPSLGIKFAIGLSVPNIRMTRERPVKTSNAVPIISETNSFQGMCRAFESTIKSPLTG